jgi:hypothetical protein
VSGRSPGWRMMHKWSVLGRRPRGPLVATFSFGSLALSFGSLALSFGSLSLSFLSLFIVMCWMSPGGPVF